MNLADTQWILVISSFLIGAGLGALAYHLMNASVAQNIRIRHQLTERELELNQLREGLNDHFSRTADGLAGLSKQLQTMEQQIRTDASALSTDETLIKRLSQLEPTESDKAAFDAATEEASAPIEPPKDYSPDSERGTLSEDFGLNEDIKEPPRH